MVETMLSYIIENYITILHQFLTHVEVSLCALLISIVIGVSIGYFASKSSLKEKILSMPFYILRIIPSLAILTLLIPFIGTGFLPAIIALSLLAIPPILLNTIVGFHEVPQFMIESAQGIGLKEQEILYHVRIPQALPLIFSGIRTGLVEVIASATLAAKIGSGGLGEIIFTGLGLNRMDLLIVGGFLVALLSIMSGLIFDFFTKKLFKYKYI